MSDEEQEDEEMGPQAESPRLAWCYEHDTGSPLAVIQLRIPANYIKKHLADKVVQREEVGEVSERKQEMIKLCLEAPLEELLEAEDRISSSSVVQRRIHHGKRKNRSGRNRSASKTAGGVGGRTAVGGRGR
eukprot:g3169.t1